MPFDQYRTVVAALDRLTTQVRRVADTMATPVVEQDDAPQTTGDDGPITAAKVRSWLPTCPSGQHVAHGGMDCAEVDEWKATAEQFAMTRRIQHLEAAEQQRDRLAATLREVLSTYSRVSTPHNDKAIAYTLPPITPDMFERWSATLTPEN